MVNYLYKLLTQITQDSNFRHRNMLHMYKHWETVYNVSYTRFKFHKTQNSFPY